MGTTQEAGRKTPDLGVRKDAEAEPGAALRLGELELKEEWQDEEFPRLLPEEVGLSEAPEDLKGDSQADELPRAEGLAASEAAERLGRGCVWDVAGEDGHHWRVFRTGQREQRVDMTAIEPYKKVLSHGGYHGDGLNAVILFASCYLPRGSIPNYAYVMEHLFRYMVGTLELLVAENYLLVHLSGGTSRAQVPPLGWIRQCYRTLDRRLRKNLRALVVVHATWYVKAFLALLRPFIRYQLWDKGSLPFAPFSSKDGEVPSSHGRSVFWTVWESWPNLSPWIKSTSLKLSDSSTGISTAQQVPSTGLGKALRTKQRWRSALPGS
nr:bcl-2/adenovirus E1B 19 kDa-interacting protein 2-like protein isoform X4 [Oryctolagus cuniculus]